MKIKHIITIIVMFLLVTPNVNANVICDKADILRVKKDANNITIDYEYIQDENTRNGLFNLKIIGLTDDLRITEEKTSKTYTSKSNVEGIIRMDRVEGDNFIFKVYYDKCDSKLVRTIKYSLPKYNYYSENDLCEGISKEDLEVCNPWYQGELNDEKFEQEIQIYKEKLDIQVKKENTFVNKIKKFLLEYYMYIIFTIIMIVIITAIIVVKRKRGILE